MDSKYNVLVNYLGDGEFKFQVRKIGEVSITKDKPVYLYNADVETINNLRVLKRMLIEIVIGAKPNGAYKVYNLDDYNREQALYNNKNVIADRRGVETVSNNDIKSILSSGSNGPILDEEPKIIPIVEETKKVEKPKTTSKKSTSKTTKKKTSKK